MILPDLVQTRFVNKKFAQTGIDSRTQCLDKDHFDRYPHEIIYQYNSYGYRDTEWPDQDQLQDCIWCFGDSFTVGLGSPRERTWVGVLEQQTNTRCINISLDGASNDWIADKIERVAATINPKHIVVQWSYLHRGQDPNTALTDSQRKIAYQYVEFAEQVAHFETVLERVKHTNAIHSMIPDAHTRIEHIESDSDRLEFAKLIKLNKDFDIINIDRVDIARDGHHYDLVTATNVVNQILPRLN